MNLFFAGVFLGPQNDATFEGEIGFLGQVILSESTAGMAFFGHSKSWSKKTHNLIC